MDKHLKQKFYEDSILPYYNGIYYYALKLLKNKEAAEDAVQSTFEKAWKNIDTLRDPEKVRSWLFTIAKNSMYSKLRKQKTRAECEFLEMAIPEREFREIETDALKALMNKEAHRILREAMELLPEKYREALELRYYWEYSEREISEIMGVKYSTARVYIHRALKELANLYTQIEEGSISNEEK